MWGLQSHRAWVKESHVKEHGSFFDLWQAERSQESRIAKELILGRN
jgi:hypothetical protein